MPLDIQTLYYMATLIAMTVGVITVAFGLHDRSYHSVVHWGLATITIALGLGLVLLRNHLDFYVGVLLANTLLIAGVVLTYRSFRIYREESTRDRVGLFLIILTLLSVFASSTGWLDIGLRSAIVTGSLAFMMMRCAWLLGIKTQPEARLSQRFTAFNYLLFSALNLFRTMAALLGYADDVLVHNWVELIYISGNALLWVGVALGVMWMVVERQQALLFRLAMYDPLTGALNRQALSDTFDREITRSQRRGECVGIAILDIDHFKRFNDTYGHLVGDRVLKDLVKLMQEVTRAEDVVGRFGGEEFLVIMPGADKVAARAVMERVRQAVEERGVTVDDRKVPLTLSAGISMFPHDGADWDMLIGKADGAMYQAKAAGRNRVVMAGDRA